MPRISPLLMTILLVIFAGHFATTLQAADKPPHVLMISIDDLNDWVGPLHGHPQVKTPAMDALALRGTTFTNAHCQAPLCNPSRTSIMTGLRPSTTGIYGLAPLFRQVPEWKDRVTLPQTFTSAGYHTVTTGKIYHGYVNQPALRKSEFVEWKNPKRMKMPPKPFVTLPNQHPAMDWGVWPERDEDHTDYQIAETAIEAIQTAPRDKPFFIACGFLLPHVPCYAPQKWFDLYPAESLTMPPILETDRDDTTMFSWYLHWKLPEPRLSLLRKVGQSENLVRSYLATISFMDAQIGRVLEALDASGQRDNTIVVLWSDHGWHLGEKAISGKNTLWERSTRVPLIFAGPGVTPHATCSTPVELLDMYPTLAEMCHLSPPADLEGHSLVPQLKDAKAARPWPAITTHNQGNHTVRNDRWRYIRYADGSEELYDFNVDPNEWHNLAKYEEYQDIKMELSRWIPKIDQPPVAGSAHRILTYDPQSHEAVWEGEVIHEDQLER
jgi:arylsulfatase A-like enzyme